MCGIVGFRQFGGDKVRGRDFDHMIDAIQHRGPDGSGRFLCDDEDRRVTSSDEPASLGLGHRRLSILDLSARGSQPMVSASGDIALTYNGELYNFHSLRDELEQTGRKFVSTSDTEVVLAAYERWGSDCLPKLVGMFAFAIYDRSSRKLILVRDRLGIKPLYYYLQDGNFAFASELKALFAYPPFRKELDLDAVSHYLTLRYIPAPRSIFRHTYKLLPGHYAVLSQDGSLEVKPYWTLNGNDQTPPCRVTSHGEVIEYAHHLLRQTVQEHLISDVPVGAFLSGGIDSTTVVALMTQLVSAPVKTYTIDFNVPEFGEGHYAAEISKYLGTDHHCLEIESQRIYETIPQMASLFDEPQGSLSMIPVYLLSRLAREKVKVVLSGDGGDELFFGYPFFYDFEKVTRLSACYLESLKSAFCSLFHHNRRLMLKGGSYGFLSEKWLRWYYREVVYGDEERLVKELLQVSNGLAGSRLESLIDETPIRGRLPDFAMDILLQTYTPDSYLAKLDRATMAVGLEGRVPLLDHRVVEFARRIPFAIKGWKGEEKHILKEVLRRYLPEELFIRPKHYFSVPVGPWFRKDGLDFLLHYLGRAEVVSKGPLNFGRIKKLVKEHLNGGQDHGVLLYRLAAFESWREHYSVH